MECDTEKGVRICPQCGYEVTDKEVLKCPRCNKILLTECSDCNKCSFI